MLKPENKNQLVAVLTYDVVPGNVMSGDIASNNMKVKTVQGSTVAVDVMSDVKIDDAMATTADIEISNGVIHIIDKVILPR